MFVRYLLRTVAIDEARVFYTRLGITPEIAELPAPARVRGAPPHWLAHVGVDDVDAARARLLARGCEPLGPPANGTFRDPWGAVFAIARAAPAAAGVAWHQLHTTDVDAAWALYAPMLGAAPVHTMETGNVSGGHRVFACDGRTVGSMANTAQWPGVHAQWLLFFEVADFEAAADAVRAGGGETIGQRVVLPGGTRLWPCHDPHRGAFGIGQRGTD